MQSALQCHRAYQARSQLALLKITPSSSRSEASSPTVRLRRCRLRRTPDRCPQNDVSCVSSVPSSTVLGQTFEVSMRECLCVSVVYVFQCAVHRNRISTSDIAFCDTTTTATPLGLQRLRCQCCRVGSVVQCCSSDCKKKLVGIRTELGYIHIYIYALANIAVVYDFLFPPVCFQELFSWHRYGHLPSLYTAEATRICIRPFFKPKVM